MSDVFGENFDIFCTNKFEKNGWENILGPKRGRLENLRIEAC